MPEHDASMIVLPRLNDGTLLSENDRVALTELFVRGTSDATARAYRQDLTYLQAWKLAAFRTELAWPETVDVALRFVLHHTQDLSALVETDAARQVGTDLVTLGLRRSLAAPAPATLDRRIASWRAFHKMRGLASPFEDPFIRATRAKARATARHKPNAKSANPITREILQQVLQTCGSNTARDARDAALLMLGWASGGRRRSELATLHIADLDVSRYQAERLIRLQLVSTKTTGRGDTPLLVLKEEPARFVANWLRYLPKGDGPLFRAISRSDRVLTRGLSSTGIAVIIKTRLREAGFDERFASAHGLRSGFLTQAALDGVPLQAAMRLSLHKSSIQAQRYYGDVELEQNPATGLWRTLK